jgi:hypothetical protein
MPAKQSPVFSFLWRLYVGCADACFACSWSRIFNSAGTPISGLLAWLVPDAERFVGRRRAELYESTSAPGTVIEFYNSTLDHYFITADTGEAAAIDNGSTGPGWHRTGDSFNAGGTTPVCRFYGSLSPARTRTFTPSSRETAPPLNSYRRAHWPPKSAGISKAWISYRPCRFQPQREASAPASAVMHRSTAPTTMVLHAVWTATIALPPAWQRSRTWLRADGSTRGWSCVRRSNDGG